jgi:hypothetical protein
MDTLIYIGLAVLAFVIVESDCGYEEAAASEEAPRQLYDD